MEIKVSKIAENRTFNGSKTYEEIDITEQVVMPIIDVERLDATLDTSSLTLINSEEKAIEPFTRMIIRIKNADNTTDNIYRLVERDDVTIYKYGANPKYEHSVQLVEITKWLERFEVDNTTITNLLQFLYTDDSVMNTTGIVYDTIPEETGVYVSGAGGTIKSSNFLRTSQESFYNTYIVNRRLNTNVRYGCSVVYSYFYTLPNVTVAIEGETTAVASLAQYTILKPGQTIPENLIDTNYYEFDTVGTYKIVQVYETPILDNGSAPVPLRGRFKWRFTFTWLVQVIDETQIEKLPTKYTLSQVVDLVLNKVGNETTIIRENIDEQMFKLDDNIRQKFDTIISPEFTFTQDTLFGVLSKVGEFAHAIPRLIPSIVQENGMSDDYSDWNIITFDFLGGNAEASEGEVTLKGSYFDGNDYTTNYVSNVQHSFQTNDAEYISLTEPFDGGWISPRTESSSYEISNDEAVIKTSRPIQRIVSLECLWFEDENTSIILDLSQHVKEITDYNLLADYAITNGIGSKQNYIYYTRGSNVIGGLTYQAPAWLSILTAWQNRAIENIINQTYGSDVGDITIKNLKFRIKYVPFYDLKVKQYKPYINDHSGNNELFYNQVNTQTVDIESLGESMKGALLRVSNEEPNITEYFANHNQCIKSGQLLDDTYYVYQVNKEINNNRIKATVQFSKDFNKWNAYVAIKKNYREWEISETESIETNPVYSNFCIISDKPEFYVLLGIYETENEMTDAQLDALTPTPTIYSPAWESADAFIVVNKVGDNYYKCKTIWNGTTRVWERQQINLKDGVLIINEKYIDQDTATQYYEALEKQKGVLNEKFFMQLISRIANTTTQDLYKISWVVGTCYSNEWQGGAEYKQVKKSFILPCACFSVGNSIVFDFGAQDNYAIATHSVNADNQYALEHYVEYGDKFGKVENLELQYGHDEVIDGAFETQTKANNYSKEFYLIDTAKIDKNKVLLDYQTNSDIEIAIESGIYKVHWSVCVSMYFRNMFGQPDTVGFNIININKNTILVFSKANALFEQETITKTESASQFIFTYGQTTFTYTPNETGAEMTNSSASGYNGQYDYNSIVLEKDEEYIPGDFTDTTHTDSIEIDNITYTIANNDREHEQIKLMATISDTAYTYNSYKTTSGMFRINKDSRQSLQFTNQLHFITDTENLWIGSALAKTMPFVGETTKAIYKLVGFINKPSKFVITPNENDYEEITSNWAKTYSIKTYSMKLYGQEAQNNYKGVGILDNKNRLVLYYNKEIKTGENTPTLYIRLRRKL